MTIALETEGLGRRYRTRWGFGSSESAYAPRTGERYQPADLYWTLQWRGSAVYLGLAGLLFGVAVLAVGRMRE